MKKSLKTYVQYLLWVIGLIIIINILAGYWYLFMELWKYFEGNLCLVGC